MKAKNILYALLAMSALAFVLVLLNSQMFNFNNPDKPNSSSPASLAVERKDSENVYVLDVRTDQEWSEEHAQGAVHWDVQKIDNGQYPDINKNAEIYLYCRSGARAQRATDALKSNGYTNVTNIGGLTDWVNAGGVVEE